MICGVFNWSAGILPASVGQTITKFLQVYFPGFLCIGAYMRCAPTFCVLIFRNMLLLCF